MKRLGKYEITEIKAVGDAFWVEKWNSETEEDEIICSSKEDIAESILIHDTENELDDGLIGFNMDISKFETEEELEEYMTEYPDEFEFCYKEKDGLFFGNG